MCCLGSLERIGPGTAEEGSESGLKGGGCIIFSFSEMMWIVF